MKPSAMTLTLFFALLLSLFISGTAAAAPLSQDAVLNGLSGRYKDVNSLTASYSRVASTPKTDKLFKSGTSQTATGILTWSRPAKLRLDQKSPQA